MSGLDPFFSLAGAWSGSNRVWLPPKEEPYESSTTATLSPIVGGKFAQLAYTWAIEGETQEKETQEGVMLIGHEPENGAVTVVWADSWHMGNKFMLCQGQIENERIVVRGTFAADGQDWGWRIELESPGATLIMRMYIIEPAGGDEALGVEAVYTRAE